MMNRKSRRNVIALLAATPFVIAGSCSTNVLTPQQVVTDCQNAVQALTTTFNQLVMTQPNLIPAAIQTKITAALADATALLASLATSMATTTSAPIVQQIESDINSVITFASGLPLPPPLSTALLAASVILPILEAYVNSVLPQPQQKKLTLAKPKGTPMTIDNARSILKALAGR